MHSESGRERLSGDAGSRCSRAGRVTVRGGGSSSFPVAREGASSAWSSLGTPKPSGWSSRNGRSRRTSGARTTGRRPWARTFEVLAPGRSRSIDALSALLSVWSSRHSDARRKAKQMTRRRQHLPRVRPNEPTKRGRHAHCMQVRGGPRRGDPGWDKAVALSSMVVAGGREGLAHDPRGAELGRGAGLRCTSGGSSSSTRRFAGAYVAPPRARSSWSAYFGTTRRRPSRRWGSSPRAMSS